MPRFFGLFALFALLLLSLYPSHAASCNPIKTFADGKKPLREIFISPSGSNSSGNGSRTAPYQTLSRALQGIQPGAAIRLLPGTYSGGNYIENVSGTAEAPIWIGGEPGATRPIISGGSLAFHLSRVRYLVIENLEVGGASGNGINCDDGGDYKNPEGTRHLVFRNLFIHDVGSGGNQDGLKVSGVNDFYVLDCEFARISMGGSGIDHVGCHNGLIARCTFSAGGNAIQCKGGSENIEIRWNKFLNGAGRGVNVGGSTGFTFFRPPLSTTEPNTEAKNIRVIANLFRGFETPVAFVGAIDSIAAHNTIIEPNRWILRILQETVSNGGYTFLPSGNNQFVNNICYFNRGQISTHINIGSNTDAPSFQFSNNLWHAFDQPNQSRPSLPSPEANGIYGSNPAFRDIGANDFSVLPNSPAAGKGKELLNARADLLERCYANPPTIGAYEATPPPTPRADFDGDGIPDDWEEANALDKFDEADATLDPDGDRLDSFGEYVAGTNPNDPRSVFRLEVPQLLASAFSFIYPTSTNRTYRVETRNLSESVWEGAGSLSGSGKPTQHIESLASHQGKLFRVIVELTLAN